MFEKDELESWINSVANKLDRECSVYMIGGGAFERFIYYLIFRY